ncbi:unnamed protein product [Didymodactylos carnosus]|uniref:Uncharacterized protein n=1 Tax=Didymodactylos carnosus TaxID=1234261 RepID=A0A813TLB5_9BILA|nr:unnamed protein product [Didymodactylos carnosus]CAF0815443.1 unnamed protein product [Didymodactylos carnosus]CAF3501276.1 unnamed protein product [Didymodactylos carnosus]CAF3601498.1 unnamed protein product [Didymodactylos carnosus]
MNFSSVYISPLTTVATTKLFDDEDLSALQYWILVGVFISFGVLSTSIISIIVYHELFNSNKNVVNAERAAKLKDLYDATGIKIELNDIRQIMMNEVILEAWKREKQRRQAHRHHHHHHHHHSIE